MRIGWTGLALTGACAAIGCGSSDSGGQAADVCGDGQVTGAEVCDDSVNDDRYGGCNADCTARAAHCGDGIRQISEGEHCDDGPDGSERCDRDCRASFERLFDANQLPEFYIEVPLDSWQTIASCTEEQASLPERPLECDYQPAMLHAILDPDPRDAVDERVTTEPRPIGIRRKGRTTWRNVDEKPSWKISFEGGQFMGLRRLTLNNLKQDPSGIRERLGYEIFRASNVPAPLANNALVFVKVGDQPEFESFGLYSNIQSLDKQFVQFLFGEVDGRVGNLFDTTNDYYFSDLDRSEERWQGGTVPGAQENRFQLETNETGGDVSDLTRLIDAIHVPNVTDGLGAFLETAGEVADVEEFIRIAAIMAVISDWDGWAGARNNYKVYHELARDRFVVLPWGIDQIFGTFSTQGVEPPDFAYLPNWGYPIDFSKSVRPQSLFVVRCLLDTDECAPRYREAVGAINDVLASLAPEGRIATMREQIAPFVDWDRAQFERHVQYVEHFLKARTACVGAQLADTPCDVLECPVTEFDCRLTGPY
jgi:hypothetical protein